MDARYNIRIAIARKLEAMGKKADGMRFRTLGAANNPHLPFLEDLPISGDDDS